jgi:Rps23 Pro-64 3,4-dihydroxylase Tpa1-like proline 4-hydroxylase
MIGAAEERGTVLKPTAATHPIFVPDVFDALDQLAAEFQAGQPFKHVVVDGLFREDFLREVAAEFYPPGDRRWHRFKDKSRQVKLMLQSEYELPPRVRELTRELNAEPFLRKLSALTGIDGIIADPYLEGGGMHQIEAGGKLAVHADFNKSTIMHVDRRLNVLVYLNEGWQEEWGGSLELWDREMTACVKRVAPVFNRMLVFLTDDFSFHGHPDPLACPPGVTRKSVAMYYYTNGRPAHELREASEQHTTLFQARPNEVFVEPDPLAVKASETRDRLINGLRRAVPRPLVALIKKVLRRP